jgi:hypothetical protein
VYVDSAKTTQTAAYDLQFLASDSQADLLLKAENYTLGAQDFSNPLFAERSLYFDKRFSGSNLRSEYARAFFPMGLPLEGYANEEDRRFDQELEFREHIADIAEQINVDGEADMDEIEVILFGV